MNPIILEAYGDQISARLRAQGLTHLQVGKRGQHLGIYATDSEGVSVNRARFSWRHGQTFALEIADPWGRWRATGARGPVPDLLAVLLDRFAVVLYRSPEQSGE